MTITGSFIHKTQTQTYWILAPSLDMGHGLNSRTMGRSLFQWVIGPRVTISYLLPALQYSIHEIKMIISSNN